MPKYRVILADPPWPDQGRVLGRSKFVRGIWVPGTKRVSVPYPTLSIDQIKKLDVNKYASKNCFLFLWVLNMYLPYVFEVGEAWGFKRVCLLTWAKKPMGLGMGGTFSSNTEHILFAKKGKPKSNIRFDTRWWSWKRGKHSAKPPELRKIIESMTPGPYLELFAREKVEGWDVWGNEVECDVKMNV